MYSLSVSKSLCIYYLFRELTINSLPFLRIHFEFTICLTNSLWIHYLCREFTTNLLPVSRIFLEYTMNSLSVLLIHYGSIGPLRNNFSNLDIFAVDDIWNVHILVRRNVIRGIKTKNEVQNSFWIFHIGPEIVLTLLACTLFVSHFRRSSARIKFIPNNRFFQTLFRHFFYKKQVNIKTFTFRCTL